MSELLVALDWRLDAGGVARLFAAIAAGTVLVLALGTAVARIAGVPIVVVQAAVWTVWLTWLGAIFPRNRRRDEGTPCAYPYRRAFLREILLGITVAFGQLLRPALSGVLGDGRELDLLPSLAIGLPLFLAGAGVVYLGVSALGVARTLFVHEYVAGERALTTAGIFQVLRHPLFLGGAMASLGLALCTGSQLALELGLLNACVVPLYVQLEDRRCCAALGQAYADYRLAVGAVIPRRRTSMAPLTSPPGQAARPPSR